MADQCPNDNSTAAIACLLRVISESSGNFDWDPLNFAFTAAIGALALIIACVTVFQNLLAAGPGRIKASEWAIGPFHVHSRSSFNSAELAVRTTARVPLITWEVLYHRIVRQKFKPSIADANSKQSSWFGRRQEPYDATATWLSLLNVTGIQDPDMFPLIKRATDYLPADVQAAPAAAELRCLAILAVIADTNSKIERQDRFFKVIGDSSQLSFREHPILGQVAAYEAYEETAILKMGKGPALQFGASNRSMSFEELDRGLQLASGRLAYADGRIVPHINGPWNPRAYLTLVTVLANRSHECGHDICDHAATDWSEAIEDTGRRRNHVVDYYMPVSLFVAERANDCRGFPKRRMRLDECLPDVLDMANFWSDEGLTTSRVAELSALMAATFWNEANRPTAPSASASWVVDFDDNGRSTVANPFFLTARRTYLYKWDFIMHVLQEIKNWLQLKKDARAPLDAGKAMTNGTISMLLCSLDQWLFKHGGRYASCAMLKFMHDLALRKDLLHIRRSDTTINWDVSTHLNIPAVNRNTLLPGVVGDEKQIPFMYRETSPASAEDVRTLLVLRAILFAMLLDGGGDTSVLFEKDFKESIVKVL